ncbi:hypothetical protein CCR95_16910 [Thiocystis minor]|uniref:hypothetical protein n=1 Tax=Thiocystis minor TaxID=61597 RepID=UPI001911F235|nr:hypothetical protein [Thiocystis minor]MBK5965715.1 hypothetical protein [Thiocystis minor]
MNDLTTIPIPTAALERLRQAARLNSEINTWKPAPGDVLEGVLAGSRMASGPFGEQRQMIIQTPAGALIAAWLTDWLLSQMKAQQAERGDLVSLMFHGREQGKTGKAFNRYSVTVLKP